MFDFATRQSPLSKAGLDEIKAAVVASCASPCSGGISRDADCACYAEFAARYWLRLGSFPSACVDQGEMLQSFTDPTHAEAANKLMLNPEQARLRAWSSVITGPARSGKTSLATLFAKAVMKWELVHKYNASTRAVYFAPRDYTRWLRRIEDFRVSPEETAYYDGALTGSVMVWDDIDLAFANEARFVADLKKRIDSQLPTHLILSSPLEMYAGSLLSDALGVDRGSLRSPGFTLIDLFGAIMARSGWV